EQLYRRFYQHTLKIALHYTRSVEEAREVVNDVFLKVFNKIGHYDPAKSFKPWLNIITVCTAIDYYRKHTQKALPANDPEILPDVAAPADIIARLSAEELQGLVQQLSPACRAAINLYAIEGYDHQEIAEMLDISVGASKSNLFKARAKLKVLMAREGE
ncbi:MAG: RNA polymerase sigma factor, partial [Saprospiraceae bacterium]